MQNKKIGLAAASIETRKRVAGMGGKAISKDIKHMALIGKKGGVKSGKNRSANARKS